MLGKKVAWSVCLPRTDFELVGRTLSQGFLTEDSAQVKGNTLPCNWVMVGSKKSLYTDRRDIGMRAVRLQTFCPRPQITQADEDDITNLIILYYPNWYRKRSDPPVNLWS